ncbi:hypothetical protein Hanom_Chr04g00319731 [Helianthus anomalus]
MYDQPFWPRSRCHGVVPNKTHKSSHKLSDPINSSAPHHESPPCLATCFLF